MALEAVVFDTESNRIEDFLRLPKVLYGKKNLMQNETEERQLLLSEHALSKYFRMKKFLVYRDGETAARCAVTLYEGDTTAYLGFFECVDDTGCSRLLFDTAARFARNSGCGQITGPVDASFWIKYRLKINRFGDGPYVSEPYNLNYYLKLFLDYGFTVGETYKSNEYKRQSVLGFHNKKSSKRLKDYARKNYVIVSPKRKDFDRVIREVYALITELYKDFPVFKMIGEEDFARHYAALKYVLDLSMVKMAYYQGEAVGFFIGLPDYGNLLAGSIGRAEMIKILLKRIRSPRYVMLYMGVAKKHRGLGLAMTQTVMHSVNRKAASAIGALIREGKVTGAYGTELVTSTYEYVLLNYPLTPSTGAGNQETETINPEEQGA